jgi:ribosomal protein L29
MGHIDNPGRIKVVKKTIARILTIMREEEIKKGTNTK